LRGGRCNCFRRLQLRNTAYLQTYLRVIVAAAHKQVYIHRYRHHKGRQKQFIGLLPQEKHRAKAQLLQLGA
jgi:hypothetical protein